MSGRFVRASKYRHVFGRTTKKESCYDNLRISQNAWDTNLVKANPEYLSVNWNASGGGAFAVIPLHETGKLPERIPLFRGHTAAVLDTDWSPFDDSFVASGSDDAKIGLYKVPKNFSVKSEKPDEIVDIEPVHKLTGHTRKVGHVVFNPSAQNILASASGDYTIKIWDVDAGKAHLTLKHPDMLQSLSWSANGSLMVTTCRDKKLRIWDARQERAIVETPGHSGAKNSRAVWMGEHDRIATTGFSRMSDRQLGLWDVRAATKPMNDLEIIDQISGVCMPFWDEGSNILFLAGKGDGNIRYYEYQNDKFEYLSQHTSPEPQRGMAFLPKRGINTHENEITRAFKTVNDSLIEPISFIVPRRAEVFQGDIYPPATGIKPAMSASDYFAGKEGLPPKIDLESLYEGTVPKEVPSDYKPATPIAPQTPVISKEAPKPAPVQEPTPIAGRAPPPSMKDNKSAISNMADKFADKGPAEHSDSESSSFEEIARPTERPGATKASAATSTFTPPAAKDAAKPAVVETASAVPAQPVAASTSVSQLAAVAPKSIGDGDSHSVATSLAEIKSLLESQNAKISEQSIKLAALTKDVETLKTRSTGGSGPHVDGAKDERIRQLELELEEARS